MADFVKITGINVKKKAGAGEHKRLAAWAADRAEQVLPNFEDHYPEDGRPRQAIAAARAWARGEMEMTEVRKFALAAHAAARQAARPAAIAAARSAGHAAATAHVSGHAKHAAAYAAKSTALRAKS